MQQNISLKNKIIFISGASSGIGKACVQRFAQEGARIILAARRIERLKDLTQEIQKSYSVDLYPLQLDVSDKQQVLKLQDLLPPEWQDIDILINNAGLALGLEKFAQCSLEQWEQMVDVNVKGLLYITHHLIQKMLARNEGHIVNIGSVAGHDCYPNGNVYSATKHAVNAITKSLRMDLLGTMIRVTEIAPGAVETEFSEVRFSNKQRADEFYKSFTPLNAEDIADAILYCLTRPAHVNISELIIYPTNQASVHHLHKHS